MLPREASVALQYLEYHTYSNELFCLIYVSVAKIGCLTYCYRRQYLFKQECYRGNSNISHSTLLIFKE